MKAKDKIIFVKADSELQSQLRIVSASLDMTASHFVRQAVREKIARVVRGKKTSDAPALNFDKQAA